MSAVEAPAPAHVGGSPAASVPKRPRVFYPCLDGLRFVLATLVMVTHTVGVGRDSLSAGDQLVHNFGQLAVAAFFALSGFLLFRPFVDSILDDADWPDLRRYAWARVLRLFPLYWFALFFYVTVFPDVELPTSFVGWVALLFFGQVYMTGGDGWAIFAAWTLCVEAGFYVLLPFIALLYRRVVTGFGTTVRDRLVGFHVMIIGQVVLTLALRALLVGTVGSTHRSLLWPPAMLDWFAAGMWFSVLAAGQIRDVEPPEWVAWLARRPWLCWGSAIGVMWVVVQLRYYFVFYPSMAQSLGQHVGDGLIAALLLLPLTLGDQQRGAIRSVLRSAPFAALGAISYGIYLWHPGFVKLFYRRAFDGQMWINPWWQLLWVFIAAVAVATATYWGVERPALNLVPGRRRTAAVVEPPSLPGEDDDPPTTPGSGPGTSVTESAARERNEPE